MEYTRKYNELKAVFDPDIKENIIPDSDIRIVNTFFTSDPLPDDFSNQTDTSIAENITFSYPVFVPEKRESKKVILLLHGLNGKKLAEISCMGFLSVPRHWKLCGTFPDIFSYQPFTCFMERPPGNASFSERAQNDVW
jgi:hypothetical protein